MFSLTFRKKKEQIKSTSNFYSLKTKMEPVSLAKRNLFGISLNHDQLRNDLVEMSREQLNVQSQRWNFDFETLKPLEENPRFEWNKLSIKKPIFQFDSDQSEMAFSSFASHEIDSDLEREEEEDEALAMPAFYQMQRVQKMKENKLSIKQFIQIANTTTVATGSLKAKEEKKNIKKKKKSTKKRSTNPQLIITFSENRKDTLRSSKITNTKTTTSSSPSPSSSTSSKASTCAETPMKQPSILSKLSFIYLIEKKKAKFLFHFFFE